MQSIINAINGAVDIAFGIATSQLIWTSVALIEKVAVGAMFLTPQCVLAGAAFGFLVFCARKDIQQAMGAN